MKLLNIDSHINGYSVSVNNCLDYNIAGAISFYNKKYLKIYCVLWGLFSNDKRNKNVNITKKVLDILGIELIGVNNINETNLIDTIKKLIDENYPVILNTHSAALFYSSMYLENSIKNINHSLIINGYDEDKKLLFIKENNINTKVLDHLTKSKPFSDYQLTYDMVIEIFRITKVSLGEQFYKKNSIYYLNLKKEIVVENVYNLIVNNFNELLNSNYDGLCGKIDEILKNNTFPNTFLGEQFRRTYYHSLNPIMDFLEEYYKLSKDLKFLNYKTDLLNIKEKVINYIVKNTYFCRSANYIKLNSYKTNILQCNSNLYEYLKSRKNIVSFEKQQEVNIMLSNEIKLFSDSENNLLKLNNIKKDEKVNDNFSFWKSEDKFKNHWLIIDFVQEKEINKIYIYHHDKNVYITKNFKIFGYTIERKRKLIYNIENNNEHINIVEFDKIKIVKLKILITKPNGGIDYAARIKKIEIY
ncbi:putative uncharacterized protein [Coprobacillus sp. CAG:698]|nr:putative uncharacterized protein [Coprobacillus sp. CAG:698]